MIKYAPIITLCIVVLFLCGLLHLIVLETECSPWVASLIFLIGYVIAMASMQIHTEIEFLKYKKIYDEAWRE